MKNPKGSPKSKTGVLELKVKKFNFKLLNNVNHYSFNKKTEWIMFLFEKNNF